VSESALSSGAYITTLYIMVDIVAGLGYRDKIGRVYLPSQLEHTLNFVRDGK
jgi:hypothetical protein